MCYLNLKPPIYFEEKHREPKENTVFVMDSSRAPKSQFYSLLCNVKLHLPIAQVKLRLEFISPIAKAKFTSPGHDSLCRLNSILSYIVGVFIEKLFTFWYALSFFVVDGKDARRDKRFSKFSPRRARSQKVWSRSSTATWEAFSSGTRGVWKRIRTARFDTFSKIRDLI